MVQIFILLLTAIIITQSTEVIKGFYAWFKETVLCMKEKRFTDIKIGVPTSIALGLWGGITLGVSLISALFEASGISYELPVNFNIFAIFTTSLLLTLGSGGIIRIFEEWKQGKQAIEELAKQQKTD